MEKIALGKNSYHRRAQFSLFLFCCYFLVLLLMSGVHVGLVVFMNKHNFGNLLQTIVPIFYWAIVAFILTLYAGNRVKKTYEIPMQQLAEGTNKVAHGDFSVYIPPLHTADKQDYLDIMIVDFNKMVEELGSVEVFKTDFFSNVSHEIKTPLAVIQNSAELLQRNGTTLEQRMEYTESILHATKRLSNLITNMLKLNKLEKQTIQPIPEPYNLYEQLCICALQFEDEWERKEIEFEADLEDQARIIADEGLLEIVWTNLLSNAIKFTNQGGIVKLTQTSNEKEFRISVSDTGCGIDEETSKHIFDKFYQGDTSRSTEGNGLGLALVQRIVEMSGGAIFVKSVLNEGTTFSVVLPRFIEKEEVNG